MDTSKTVRTSISMPSELISRIRRDILARAVRDGTDPQTLSAWLRSAADEKLGGDK